MRDGTGRTLSGMQAATSAESYSIEIVATETGWSLAINDLNTGDELRALNSDRLDVGQSGGDAILVHLRHAFVQLTNEEVRRCRQVRLAVDDPAIVVMDNRVVQIPGTDPIRIAQYAREMTGSEQCGFDHMVFGKSSDEEIQRNAFAFAPLDRLKQYLAAAGDLAIKVRVITSCHACLLEWAKQDPDTTFVALNFSGSYSSILAAETSSGALVIRDIPVGLFTLGHALSEANSLPLDEGLDALGRRNFLAALPKGPAAGDAGEKTAQSGAARAMAPLVWQLRDTLLETLDYFSAHRLAPTPRRIAVIGAFDRATGLRDWLASNGSSRLQDEVTSLTRLARILRDSTPLNLLRGTDQPLIMKGRTKYRFDGEAFVAEQQDHADTPAQPVTRKVEKRKRVANGRAGQNRNSKYYPYLAGIGAVLMLFLSYDTYLAPQSMRLSGQVDSLQFAISENSELLAKENANRLSQTALAGADNHDNKILWTEKFLLIASALPATLWLTDAYIVHNERRIGKVDVLTTKFVIRGGAPLRGQDHLRDIARFIDRLENDQEFMRDFRRISFEGTKSDVASADQIVTFEIHAWYDRNKRQGMSSVSGEKQGPLGQMQDKIDNRQRQQLDIVTKPGLNSRRLGRQ